MSNPDGYKAALLDFLTDNIVGRERDAVIRAFYEYAEGDPHSHPVGMAILLLACGRQMARLPENVRFGVTELQTLVTKVVQVEQDLLEKLARENHSTHSAIQEEASQFLNQFKTEVSRGVASFTGGSRTVQQAWEEVVQNFGSALSQGQKIQFELRPIVASAERIAGDFHAIKNDLKLRDESDKRTLDAVESLKTIHRENQQQGYETQALIRSLTKEARANWTTIGYLTGIFLASLFYRMPWWGTWTSFAAILGLLQWLSRHSWQWKKR